LKKCGRKKRKPFVALSISKKPLTRSLEISFGIEWRNLGFLCILEQLSIGIYEEVKVKIRTSAGISESFRSDIGVKQGCPLSPTLFGLYIDKLEEWLNFQEGDGALLGEFVIRLLLYADDLIQIAKFALGLQEHLISLEHFCSTVGTQVNTSKTKEVVFSSKRKHNQHKFYFEGIGRLCKLSLGF
jgi:hypothetical protein